MPKKKRIIPIPGKTYKKVSRTLILGSALLIIGLLVGCASDEETERSRADQTDTDEAQEGTFPAHEDTRRGTDTGENGVEDRAVGDMSKEEYSADRDDLAETEEIGAEDSRSVAEAENGDQSAETENEAAENGEAERKIIREQWLKQQVQDLSRVIADVERSVHEMPGAYIESLHEWQSEERTQRTEHHAQVIMRIPHQEWDDFEEVIEEQGTIQHRQVTGTDVTEEYIDNEARLRNLTAHEERILDLYDEADDIEDMLDIEEELSRIRGSIEEIEGRQQYLDTVTSTVKVTLELFEVEEHEYAGAENGESLWDEAWLGFQHSANSLLLFMQRTIVTLVSLSPYLLPLAVIGSIIFFGRRTYIHYKKKNG